MSGGTPAESPAPARYKLVVENVSKVFQTGSGPVVALDGINIEVREGEFVSCLVGPSGSGKSTLLNIIAGIEKPDTGRVLVDGQPIDGPGRDRMVMFQESALFPWLNAMDNVLFSLNLKPGLSQSHRREVAEHYLEMVGLGRFGLANLHELSGGMKQRVALARALAPNPTILLMDEPFAALDAMTREQLYTDLQEIWRKQRKTIVFVTHNVREAICLGDRILLLSPSPGRIQDDFTIKLDRPRDINSIEVARYATEITTALRRQTQPAAGQTRP